MYRSLKSLLYLSEVDIFDWDRCFNCVFAKKWRNERYTCRILQLLKSQKRYSGRVTVFTKGKCTHLIKRPEGCAETHGSLVIIYNKRRKGVENITERDEWHENYMSKLEKIRLELNLPELAAVNKNFSWSFTSSKKYVLIRNKLAERGNLSALKYVCERCKLEHYYKSVEIHHVRARSQNGSHSTANLEILCNSCHRYETLKLFS